MEAFSVLASENSTDVWIEWFKMIEECGRNMKYRRLKKTKLPQDQATLQKGYYHELNDAGHRTGRVFWFGDKFKTNHSRPNAGSGMFTGWSPEAKERFIELVQKNREVRTLGDEVVINKERWAMNMIAERNKYRDNANNVNVRVDDEDQQPPVPEVCPLNGNLDAEFHECYNSDEESNDGDGGSGHTGALTAEQQALMAARMAAELDAAGGG